MTTFVTSSLGLERHKPPEQMGAVINRRGKITKKTIVVYLSFRSRSLRLIFDVIIKIIIEDSWIFMNVLETYWIHYGIAVLLSLTLIFLSSTSIDVSLICAKAA